MPLAGARAASPALLRVPLPPDKVLWRKAPSPPPPEQCQGLPTRQTGAAASRLGAGTCPCPPCTPRPGLGTGSPELCWGTLLPSMGHLAPGGLWVPGAPAEAAGGAGGSSELGRNRTDHASRPAAPAAGAGAGAWVGPEERGWEEWQSRQGRSDPHQVFSCIFLTGVKRRCLMQQWPQTSWPAQGRRGACGVRPARLSFLLLFPAIM